ncbi:MAG: hypothetical protein HQK97_03765 [Nitrospirae bacterium]|nr:hypothetical protein [Nitrospirota bacterium]
MKAAYFIELKGTELFHAIDQITRTIKLLSDKITGYKINARIVLTKVTIPEAKNNPKILRFEKMLRGYNNGNLKTGTSHFIEPVNTGQ